MNQGMMLKLENLVQLHCACRQLHSLSYRKIHRTQWKPVKSSTYPMRPIQPHPQLWQTDTFISVVLSQYRLLATKEVMNKFQQLLYPCLKVQSAKKAIFEHFHYTNRNSVSDEFIVYKIVTPLYREFTLDLQDILIYM